MQFAQNLIEKILAGEKTQTRRPVKPADRFDWLGQNGKYYPCLVSEFRTGLHVYRIYRNHRLLWQVGKTYAICPGRGKPQIARFRILHISMEDVRLISDGDVRREGFKYHTDFWDVWQQFYSKKYLDAWVLSFELTPNDG
jgi:hypothetical protein